MRYVLGKYSSDEDGQVDLVYQPHTSHIPTTHTDYILTTYKPHTNQIPTTYQPYTDHIPTTYWPHSLFLGNKIVVSCSVNLIHAAYLCKTLHVKGTAVCKVEEPFIISFASPFSYAILAIITYQSIPHCFPSYPFSENEMSVIGPECPGNFATLALSFRSQILIRLKRRTKTAIRTAAHKQRYESANIRQNSMAHSCWPVHGSSSKDQTIRMKLSTGETWKHDAQNQTKI